MSFTCRAKGSDPHSHATVELARKHYLGETWDCGWQFEARGPYGVEYDQDGEQIILECGGLAYATDRGWECENGHEHVNAEVRADERWDYAADAGEAQALTQAGVRPHDMTARVWV